MKQRNNAKWILPKDPFPIDRRILGMVCNGNMEGVMILSQKALRLGFKNESDKKILLFMSLFI